MKDKQFSVKIMQMMESYGANVVLNDPQTYWSIEAEYFCS